jgi:filamentous hemagglutinin
MDNARIAAAREAGIGVQARVSVYSDPLTHEIQQAREWQN